MLSLWKQAHVCPINTRVNHHIYNHTYTPQYTCCEENEIRVFGKGAKERIVLISDRAKQYLIQYINTARKLLAPGYDIGEINENSIC